MKIHRRLPEGAKRSRYETEFYVLRGRARMMYIDNYDMRVNLRYLIWSQFARAWYERVVREEDLPENYRYYHNRRMLWLWPTEENKEEMLEETKKAKVGWYSMNKKRQTELDHDRLLKEGNKGDGFQTRNQMYKDIRYKR